MHAPTEPRWMLVDDNEDILMMVSLMLEALTGATIERYNNPQAALAAFTAAPEQYELVITDFEMPEMNGLQLCQRLLAIAPAQKIFLATGSGYFTAAAARRAGFSALLNKPFPMSTLQAALAETFGDRAEKAIGDLVAA